MILKVTGTIWNTNAALSRLFGKQRLGPVKKRPGPVKRRLGAVKNRPESREFCDAPPQRRHRSAKIPCQKISQIAIFA